MQQRRQRKNKKSVIKLKVTAYVVAFFNKKLLHAQVNAEKGGINMPEFKTIETQEELDRIIGERLARQKEKYAGLEKFESRVKELEKTNAELLATIDSNSKLLAEKDEFISAKESELAEVNQVVEKFKGTQLRTQIALRNGLPYELVDRLQGSDEESLQADAERLSAFIKPKPVAPLKDVEPVVGDDRTTAMRQMLQQLNQ